jgi:alkanesulfonate monooxygenase SsuD/methylene tetrahydromethanopterin reductase-like flavin-dependent oxidoreductase (luciferase family)
MRFGIHLPLIGFEPDSFKLTRLLEVVRVARRAGFTAVSANDHLVFSRPWLDGLTALAAVLPESGNLTLATTVSVPAIRGPVPLAKALAALDVLSGGRVVACIGPGSSSRDYAAVGLDFAERWKRLEECASVMRRLWSDEHVQFSGTYYYLQDLTLEPRPVQSGGPPLWIGSWGSEGGLRRVARLADGWLASAYNTTPSEYARAWTLLSTILEARQKEPAQFPNALATMFLYLTSQRGAAERLLAEMVAPTLNRTPDQLRERLLICSVAEAVDKLNRYREAGLQMVYLWPIADEPEQVELFAHDVIPFVK